MADGRKIIHVDMDAFYASVEQRDRPELLTVPVVVGGSPESRGVVCSASYDARKFGVRSAMPSREAYRLCPTAVFVSPRFTVYRDVSRVIQSIFAEVTERFEPLALDEAYLDVTENLLGEPLATPIVHYLRSRIRGQTGLTASAGAGPNKFIAKLASSMAKPNGVMVVPPSKVDGFVENLDVESLWGVGPKTAQKLRRASINTTRDIREAGERWMKSQFGKHGGFLYALAHGQDDREVSTDRFPKSRSSETTFEKDIRDLEYLRTVCRELAQDVAASLEKSEALAIGVNVKARYSDFRTVTRSRRLGDWTRDVKAIEQAALALLEEIPMGNRALRLLGVGSHDLVPDTAPRQLDLFES